MTKIKLRKRSRRTVTVSSAESIFREWMDDNMDRFKIKPISNGKGKYSFKGIIKNIHLQLDYRQPESMICFDGLLNGINDNFDLHSIEYIGEEKYHPSKGYYDADRTDDVYDYFPTRKELYINNVFEPTIEYCNKMLVPENSLYLIRLAVGTSGFAGEASLPGARWEIAGGFFACCEVGSPSDGSVFGSVVASKQRKG